LRGSSRVCDGPRTPFESRVSFRDPDEDAEEIATPTRRFSLLEITSGLPDDPREADEQAAERRLRELRGRVKTARAAISTTPGAEEVLRQDLVKAAHFYARFWLSGTMFRCGVPVGVAGTEIDSPLAPRSLASELEELRVRESATLPDPELGL
jgi:hypothetical protein